MKAHDFLSVRDMSTKEILATFALARKMKANKKKFAKHCKEKRLRSFLKSRHYARAHRLTSASSSLAVSRSICHPQKSALESASRCTMLQRTSSEWFREL